MKLLRFVLPLLLAAAAGAQTVSPVIVEYKQKGEGKILLTNNTLTPLVVVLQPQSFSIAPDGTATYRPLDPGIHVSLSTSSVRLQPRQEYYVFYKTHADALPAWYTIYATFSGAQRGPGINLRIMLPHTVYLYQKQPLQKEEVHVSSAAWDQAHAIVTCDIVNTGHDYGRMREGTVQAGKESAPVNGFPLLPGSPRHLEIPWTGKNPPEQIVLHFDRFEIKLPLTQGQPLPVASLHEVHP
jgi:hypothetical protein